jgi:outer membrane phospholipase A
MKLKTLLSIISIILLNIGGVIAKSPNFNDERKVFEDIKSDSTFHDRLTSYQPMYFLYGIEPSAKKSSFQLSFKYRLFSEQGLISDNIPWIVNTYFGYVQKSLWDLNSKSKPFEDTSYMPELFYKNDDLKIELYGITLSSIQTGFRHESNGQSDDFSRSTNYIYFKPSFNIYDNGITKINLNSEAFFYVNNDDSGNEDLEKYRGYGYISADFVKIDSGFKLSTKYVPAQKGDSFQIDMSYPLTELFDGRGDLAFYLYVQYYNGYSETLLNYSIKDDIIRLGFAFVP